jgi:hypothetical protein
MRTKLVLSDKRRVLVQRGLQQSIGMSTSGGSEGAQRLVLFIEGLAKKGVNCNDLAVRIRTPILFRPSVGGRIAYGYEATIINDICDAVLEARRTKGALAPQQKRFATQCESPFNQYGIFARSFPISSAPPYSNWPTTINRLRLTVAQRRSKLGLRPRSTRLFQGYWLSTAEARYSD